MTPQNARMFGLLVAASVAGGLAGCAAATSQIKPARSALPSAKKTAPGPPLPARSLSPPTSSPPAASKGPVAPLVLVLREGALDSARGKDTVLLHGPVRVRPRAVTGAPLGRQDLPLRLLLPGGGYLDAVRRATLPGGERPALGLYAQRKTPLFHEPGRRPLGSASPGAFLVLHSLAPPEQGRYVQVSLPLFARYRHLPYLPCEPQRAWWRQHDQLGNVSKNRGTLLAWVALADLGSEPGAALQTDPWVPPLNHSYPLRDAPGGKVFMQLQCGPFRVVAEREGHLQLAQLRYGIELTGWLAQEELRSQAPASSGCVSRSMAARGLPRCWEGSLGRGRSIPGSGGYTGGINGAGIMLHAGQHQVVLRGTGAALLTRGGQQMGWLPPGTRLQVETPELSLAARDSLFTLGKVAGGFRLGEVEYQGEVEIHQAQLAATVSRPSLAPATQPAGASRAPAPATPPAAAAPSAPPLIAAADPRRSGRQFMARAFRPGTRLWLQSAKDGCWQLPLHKLARKRTPEGRRVWLLELRVPFPGQEKIRPGCLCREEVRFDDRAALLSFAGASSCQCRGPDRQGYSGRGGHGREMLQVVALEKDRAVLVHGSDYTRYAPEDAAALYFSRAACEAGTERILVR